MVGKEGIPKLKQYQEWFIHCRVMEMFNTRETVLSDTPASVAISFSVAILSLFIHHHVLK